MMNPSYHFNRMRELIEEFEPSPLRDRAVIKLNECEMLLSKCTPTKEATERDLQAPAPAPAGYRSDLL